MLVGLGVGLILSLAVGRLASSLLVGITPHDPFALLAVAAILALVGGATAFTSAAGSSRVEPMEQLRAN